MQSKFVGALTGIGVAGFLYFFTASNSWLSAYLPVVIGSVISGFIAKQDGTASGFFVGVSQSILLFFGAWILTGSTTSGWVLINILVLSGLGMVFGKIGQWCRSQIA